MHWHGTLALFSILQYTAVKCISAFDRRATFSRTPAVFLAWPLYHVQQLLLSSLGLDDAPECSECPDDVRAQSTADGRFLYNRRLRCSCGI